jgi:hypothetical protein
MLPDPPPPAPPLVAATTAVTPSPELPPPGEAILPVPTAEQAQAADRVFTAPTQPDPLGTLLGVGMCAMLLHDMAVDIFDTSSEEEPSKQDDGKDNANPDD